MAGQRGTVSERIRRALYVLSRGHCYAPGCPSRVIVVEQREPIFVGEVAHIVAAEPGGPRGGEPCSNTEAFSNLLILCGEHHKIIDNRTTWKLYPSKTLHEWKKQRESEFDTEALGLLERAGPIASKLPNLLLVSFKETAAELSETVDKLEKAGHIAHGAAELLREAVERLPSQSSELHESARLLAFFAEAMPNFDSSANQIGYFAETITGNTLLETAEALEQFCNKDLTELHDAIAELKRTVSALPNVEELRQAASEFPSVDEYRAPRAGMPYGVQATSPVAPEVEEWTDGRTPRRVIHSGPRSSLKLIAWAFGVGVVAGGLGVGWLYHDSNQAAQEERAACTGPSVPPSFTVIREVEVDATPSISPSPFTCSTWYPQPLTRPTGR